MEIFLWYIVNWKDFLCVPMTVMFNVNAALEIVVVDFIAPVVSFDHLLRGSQFVCCAAVSCRASLYAFLRYYVGDLTVLGYFLSQVTIPRWCGCQVKY